jgi:hypothetical protein
LAVTTEGTALVLMVPFFEAVVVGGLVLPGAAEPVVVIAAVVVAAEAEDEAEAGADVLDAKLGTVIVTLT